MNKLYSVQYFTLSGACTIVGLFRDENMAIIFKDSKNEELKKMGKSVPKGHYTINPLYTDF